MHGCGTRLHPCPHGKRHIRSGRLLSRRFPLFSFPRSAFRMTGVPALSAFSVLMAQFPPDFSVPLMSACQPPFHGRPETYCMHGPEKAAENSFRRTRFFYGARSLPCCLFHAAALMRLWDAAYPGRRRIHRTVLSHAASLPYPHSIFPGRCGGITRHTC